MDFSVSALLQTLPTKGVWDPPVAQVDGAGFHSRPDWSHPSSLKTDVFKDFRQHWMQTILSQNLHKEITQHFAEQRPEPPFDSALVTQMRESIEQLLRFHNIPANWDVPQNQPLCLHILQALPRLTGDPDSELFHHLIEGVPTGFLRNIPPSHCFDSTTSTDDEPPPLSVHFDGWKSAHDDPEITSELVQEELRQGWVFEFPGTLADAQAQYPVGVSVGKLGVATSSRPPRLIVDSSICGLNQNCPLPEKGSLPSSKDLIRSFLLRNSTSPLSGLSLDVKSAHKRVAIHPSEHGLVGFRSGKTKYSFTKFVHSEQLFLLIGGHDLGDSYFVQPIDLYISLTALYCTLMISSSFKMRKYCHSQQLFWCYFFVRSTCPFLGRNANSLIQSPGLVGSSIFTADWSQCTLTNRRNSWTSFLRY